jgi:hypothetical protein
MKTTMMMTTGLCFLLSGFGVARADVAVGVSASMVVEPAVPVPTFVPPSPPSLLPQAPVPVHPIAPAPRVVETIPVATGGQWVYTAQYGWLYMPYGERFVLTQTAAPYAYVYYPSFGWRWLVAPWLAGSGPYPYFGAHGPFAYGWYRGLQQRHPMVVHYAHLGHRPIATPVRLPVRPVHGVRAVAPRAPMHTALAPRGGRR